MLFRTTCWSSDHNQDKVLERAGVKDFGIRELLHMRRCSVAGSVSLTVSLAVAAWRRAGSNHHQSQDQLLG